MFLDTFPLQSLPLWFEKLAGSNLFCVLEVPKQVALSETGA